MTSSSFFNVNISVTMLENIIYLNCGLSDNTIHLKRSPLVLGN